MTSTTKNGTSARPAVTRRVATRPTAAPPTTARPTAVRRPMPAATPQDEYLEGITARTASPGTSDACMKGTTVTRAPAKRPTAARAPVPAQPALEVPKGVEIPEPTGIATPAELAALFQKFGPIKYFQGQQQNGYTLGYHLQLVLDQILRDKGLV